VLLLSELDESRPSGVKVLTKPCSLFVEELLRTRRSVRRQVLVEIQAG
jgi:hypothetical protein